MSKIWFKPKIFGWGWVPVSIEGWILTAIFVFILYVTILTSNLSWWPWINKVIVIGGEVLLFSYVADKHTTKPLLFK